MTVAIAPPSQAEFMERLIASPAGQALIEAHRAEELERRREAESAIAEIKAKASGTCSPLKKELDKLLEEIEADQRKLGEKRQKYRRLQIAFQGASNIGDIGPHQRFLMAAHAEELREFIGRLEAERERLRDGNLVQEKREPRYWLSGRIDNALLRSNHPLIRERILALWGAERAANELVTWKAEVTADFQALWDGLPGIDLTKANADRTTFDVPMFEGEK
jgi:DNA repair exonuclease SbcCD ATPase subunit